MRVDAQKAMSVKAQLQQTEKELLQDINKIAGFDVEIWAAASIAKAFEKVKLPYDRTEKGAPSFTKNRKRIITRYK